MRHSTKIIALAATWAACAGTDDLTPNASANADENGSDNAVTSNANPNAGPNGDPNGDPNVGSNNTLPDNADPNGDPNNIAVNNPANNTPANNTPANNTPANNDNNAATTWRALVANAELGGNTSTWSILDFDGAQATVGPATAFGNGSIAVAASGGRGYIADLDSGMVLVIDAATGQEVDTLDLGVASADSVAASDTYFAVASGSHTEIAQYSYAAGGLSPSIPLPGSSVGSMFARGLSIDDRLVAAVLVEDAPFPTTPQVFIGNLQDSTLVGTVGVAGAKRVHAMGAGKFAVATATDGIVIVRPDASGVVADQTLVESTLFRSGSVDDVVMASPTRGLAFTSGVEFRAWVFDADGPSATQITGLALPSGLIGGAVTSDGLFYFVGDYGIRDMVGTPWGVGVVDAAGNLVDHALTDSELPPTGIAALD